MGVKASWIAVAIFAVMASWHLWLGLSKLGEGQGFILNLVTSAVFLATIVILLTRKS